MFKKSLRAFYFYKYLKTDIIKQCKEGPFHTKIIDITIEDFNNLVTKLMNDNEPYFLINLIAIYCDYNRNKIIDYYLDKGNVDMLLGFLNYCYDFDTEDNPFDQKYIVDKLIQKNDKQLITEILNSRSLYFLTNKNEKERLTNFASNN